MKRVTPEEVAGIRRLLSERPLGGLRPVEIPRAVLDRLAQALFDLAELQETTAALVGELSQSTSRCEHHTGCAALATQYLTWEGDSETMCDEHARDTAAADAPSRVEDLSYAPAWRSLRALVEVPRG